MIFLVPVNKNLFKFKLTGLFISDLEHCIEVITVNKGIVHHFHIMVWLL